MDLDYAQEFTLSTYDIRRGFLNGKSLGGGNTPLTVAEVFSAMEANWTREVWDEKAGVHRGAFTAPLAEKSPTGIPLAPLQITGDDSSRWVKESLYLARPHQYPSALFRLRKNQSKSSSADPDLGDTAPVIDVSIPLAVGNPLSYHFNGPDKGLRYYEKIIPWVFPLEMEGSTVAKEEHEISAVPQPQLVALINLVTNAPPIRVWICQPMAPDPDKDPIEEWWHHLNPSAKNYTTVKEICDSHLQAFATEVNGSSGSVG